MLTVLECVCHSLQLLTSVLYWYVPEQQTSSST